MEHFKKYWLLYLFLLAILIWAIYYFGFRKKSDKAVSKLLSEPQKEIGEIETKQEEKKEKARWYFSTVITTASVNQKRLAVNINAGEKSIPHQFEAGKRIKLRIHQTADYTYDVPGKIISIDSNRDSMLVTFSGKVTDKAFGEIEL